MGPEDYWHGPPNCRLGFTPESANGWVEEARPAPKLPYLTLS